jgi:H+-transporting ATPase
VELAKRQAVVRRLSALEDLVDMTMLLTDKTGTLTENKLHVDAFEVFSLSERDALSYALACTTGESSPLDTAVAEYAHGRRAAELPRSGFVPADSERKHSTATVALPEGARTLSLGAPQVVIALCDPSPEERRRFEAFLERAASAGKRVLALSAGEAEAHMRLAALLAFSDPLREDVPRVLSFLQKSGVQVKMLTGDTRIIAADTARRLGFAGEILPREAFDDRAAFPGAFARAAGFAEMLPKDKLLAVEEAKKRYVVAVTGDGVNDVPAVRAADVGIAVRNAVDALRSTADIVLLDNGLRVIGDAVIEARTVFMRLYHYSIFRISESFRVILTIAIIGLLLKTYPLTPIELILLALLNDIPVVSIAFDRVRVPRKPAAIDVKGRFLLSSLLGLTGVGNSLCMLWILLSLQVPWEQVQTVFFLKLVVSGHLLLYVAHTEERWWRFFPSLPVIVSISLTQLLATALAVSGLFVAPLSWPMVLFVWIWSFFWMQVSELAKYALERLRPVRVEAGGSEPAVRPRYTV